MKTTHTLAFLASAGLFAACGGGTGEIEFELALGNDNIRAINVTFGAETRTATINDFTITLDEGFVEEAEDPFFFFEEKEVFNFGAEREVEFEQAFEIEPILFNEIGILLGDADAAIAAEIGDADYEGNSIRMAGTIDLDPDVAGEETTLIVRVPAATLEEAEFEFAVDVEVEADKEIKAEVIFELEAFFAGVDFEPLIAVDGVLVLDADNVDNAAAVLQIQANLEGAMTAISE